MNRFFFIVVIWLTSNQLCFSQKNISLSDGYISSIIEKTEPEQTVIETDDGIIVTYQFNNATLTSERGESFINISGFSINEEPGQPAISNSYSARHIKLGTNVTGTKTSGPVIVNFGRTVLEGRTVEIQGETTVTLGAEFEIVNP